MKRRSSPSGSGRVELNALQLTCQTESDEELLEKELAMQEDYIQEQVEDIEGLFEENQADAFALMLDLEQRAVECEALSQKVQLLTEENISLEGILGEATDRSNIFAEQLEATENEIQQNTIAIDQMKRSIAGFAQQAEGNTTNQGSPSAIIAPISFNNSIAPRCATPRSEQVTRHEEKVRQLRSELETSERRNSELTKQIAEISQTLHLVEKLQASLIEKQEETAAEIAILTQQNDILLAEITKIEEILAKRALKNQLLNQNKKCQLKTGKRWTPDARMNNAKRPVSITSTKTYGLFQQPGGTASNDPFFRSMRQQQQKITRAPHIEEMLAPPANNVNKFSTLTKNQTVRLNTLDEHSSSLHSAVLSQQQLSHYDQISNDDSYKSPQANQLIVKDYYKTHLHTRNSSLSTYVTSQFSCTMYGYYLTKTAAGETAVQPFLQEEDDFQSDEVDSELKEGAKDEGGEQEISKEEENSDYLSERSSSIASECEREVMSVQAISVKKVPQRAIATVLLGGITAVAFYKIYCRLAQRNW